MRELIAAAAIAAFALAPLPAGAQGGEPPTTATDITAADIEAVRNWPEGRIDRQLKVVDIGKLNVAVGVLHREAFTSEDGAPRGLVHSQVTEVYYVLSGSGTLVTGGDYAQEREFAADHVVVTELVGPTTAGAASNGQIRQVSAGDVVVIPAGVFHGWSAIPDHVTYLSIRPDPDRVLPTGYVHPALE